MSSSARIEGYGLGIEGDGYAIGGGSGD